MAKVLLLDDDSALLRVMVRILTIEGFSVDACEAGEVAITELETHPPDLIVLDLNLPEMDGRQFYRTARDLGYAGPVLICSGYGAEEAKNDLGADGALKKPFDIEVLLSTIQELLSVDS